MISVRSHRQVSMIDNIKDDLSRLIAVGTPIGVLLGAMVNLVVR